MVDFYYASLINTILAEGFETYTRNATRKRIICFSEIQFKSTPLVTLRKTAWKSALREWEWFMSGSNNINELHESVKKWWEPWANENGRVLFNYSVQFRNYDFHFDQIEQLVKGIKEHPYSTRNLITTWHTREMNDPSCPITNCHGTVIQAFVDGDDSLHLKTYQRSVDVICGLPHNWIQYWAFLLWLSERTDKKVGSLIWIGGDMHIYQQHYDIAKRIINVYVNPAPVLNLKSRGVDFKADDFELNGEYRYSVDEKVEMVI